MYACRGGRSEIFGCNLLIYVLLKPYIMQSFEIEHWNKTIKVVQLAVNEYGLFYNNELIASVVKQVNNGRSSWISPNLDEDDANLVGSIITSTLF